MDGAYPYDSNELATSDTNTCDNYGHFDQMRHTGPANAQLQGVRFAQPVGETGFNQSQVPTETCYNSFHLEYVSPNTQPAMPRHTHFHSKLRPPTLYHHHTHPSDNHASTLPPIQHHTNVSSGGVPGGGMASHLQDGTPKPTRHMLPKLPTIVQGRNKAYAGKNHRIG